MFIILSQNIDKESVYKDIPFFLYHYPKRYRYQIKTGDIFIYYQGDRHKRENRYYFGYGLVGKIDVSEDGEDYYAHIVEGVPFRNKVPIYNPLGGYYESIGYEIIRNKPTPSWQNSVRKLSNDAYTTILEAGGVNDVLINQMAELERMSSNSNPITLLENLNQKYKGLEPLKKDKIISSHLDRGRSITDALKQILGAKCQICNWIGFIKTNGERYIEAHHISQLSLSEKNSLCSDNVILVCPNCHRKVHHANDLTITDLGDIIEINFEGNITVINKNTTNYLRNFI
ncbi:HNH endonuclease [Fictibacillus nanhaiensis]|uniref:HNH endonuclease n=1 Tax=Fictibacillus nanhaiensis TaxID=742169 RepID=UPI003C212DE3